MKPWPALVGACLAAALAATARGQGYEDRVLEEGPQPKLQLERDLDPGRTAGWARGIRMELTAASGRSTVRDQSVGLGISGFIDTPNHGSLSLSANVTQARQWPQGGGEVVNTLQLWRVEQRNLPLDGGWQANHSIGDLTSLLVPMARSGGRIGLPATPIEGVTAQYVRGPATEMAATVGRPGLYSGLGINGFSPDQGLLAFGGFQHGWAAAGGVASVGAQWASAARTPDRAVPSALESVDSAWTGARWRQSDAPGRMDGLQVQANLITSRRSGSAPPGLAVPDAAWGSWLDASWRSGALLQSAGAFQMQPGLRWANEQSVSDLRGAYWRGDYSTRQWQWGLTGDWSQRVSDGAGASGFYSATGRYRIDSQDSLWAIASARTGSGSGESAQVGWSMRHRLGLTQWRAEAQVTETDRARRFGVEHSLDMPEGSTLSLALGQERGETLGVPRSLATWGVLGSVRPSVGTRLDANLVGAQGGGRSQVSGNVALGWQLDSHWSVLAQYTASRSQDVQPSLQLVSALTAAATQAPLQQRYQLLQVTLRYQERAGSVSAPLGGMPGSGAGALEGTVYFDGDGNGRRETGEAGVPDVSIVLDGRWVTRTDAQGRYVFPAVAAGRHLVAVVPDNVPLPWAPLRPEAQPVEILIRTSSRIDFPIVRQP